jgi:hypothetical protein
MNKKFEYIDFRIDWYSDAIKKLNELGDKGWELVSVTQELDSNNNGDDFRALLIRYTLKRIKNL